MKTERLLRKASQVLAGTTAGIGLAAAMAVMPAVAHAQYAVADTQLQSSVSSAIQNDSKLANKGITASVSQGVVTLTGNVATEDIRDEAEGVAAGVSGVRSIQDNLDVANTPAQTASADTQSSGTAMPPPPGADDNGQNAGAMPPPPPAADNGQNANGMPPPPPASPGTAESGMPPAPPTDQSANQGYTPYPGQNQGQYAPPAYGGDPNANGGWGPRGNAHVPSAPSNLLAVSPQQQNASGPVTIPAGTLLSVRTTQPLSTANLKGGEYFQVTAAADVYQNGVVAIPRGAVLNGQVIEAKNAGAFGGSPHLDLKITSLQLGPTTYPIVSDDWDNRGPSKTGYTAANTAGGAVFGALVGAIAGGGVGAGVGAIAGGATGAAVSGATRGPRLTLPPETLLQFHVTQPLTVQPLKFQDAQQVAASAPQVPTLQRRPPYPPPGPYYVRPYPYGYPPAY